VKVSFIVSAFNRPQALRCVLASLQIQTEREIEVIVADNSDNVFTIQDHIWIVDSMRDLRFRHRHAAERTCYESTKTVSKECIGDWLCFPNDDGYYVPEFTARMLKCAEANPESSFIFCDEVYDPRMSGEYCHHNTIPVLGGIDKGTFIVKRSAFSDVDFPPAPDDMCRDGLLVDLLVSRGVNPHKCAGIMVVHN